MNSPRPVRRSAARTENPRRRFRPSVETLDERINPVLSPLVQPAEISSFNGVADVLTTTLTMAQTAAMVGDTAVTNAFTYNGTYVGPTLRADPGDVLDITLVNNLPAGETVNLHTHGLHVSPIGNSDNVLLHIEPTESNRFRIQIPADHPQGLYWYHPHMHELAAGQISRGLSGLLVIGRADGGAVELNAYQQITLALKHALLSGNQITVPTLGQNAQTFTVNGQLNPLLTLPANRAVVFDVANIGHNAFFNITLRDQANAVVPLRIVAADGVPFTSVQQPGGGGNLGMPSGRRWSFTFVPPAAAVNGWTLQTTGFSAGGDTWPAATLMTINWGLPGAALPPPAVGTPLTAPNNPFEDLRTVPLNQIAAFRTVQFQQNGLLASINGQPFPNNTIFQPRLGTVEEWTLVNPTTQDHPFHLHTVPQQVVNAAGQPNGLPFFFDVINVPKGQTVKIRIKWTDFLGTMVYHCHRVDHEDQGMMALVSKIIPNEPVYALGANARQRSFVQVTNPVTGTVVASFLAFEKKYKGGVSVAVGDVNGDGVYDVIVGKSHRPTPGSNLADLLNRFRGRPSKVDRAEVKVIDGTKLTQVDANGVILSSALLGHFFAYRKNFLGGLFVSSGDVNGDGLNDVITGPSLGARAKIRVIDATKLVLTPKKTIPASALLANFRPFGASFDGGVRVACGDLNGDGRFEIIAGQGPGGKSQIKVFDGMDQTVLADLSPFGNKFKGGVYLGTGNIKGFAFDDLIVGKGEGKNPLVSIFSQIESMSMMHSGGLHLMPVDSFAVYTPNFKGGVRVTSLHDVTPLPTFGGNKDNVVTTQGKGDGTAGSIFSRTIPVPP